MTARWENEIDVGIGLASGLAAVIVGLRLGAASGMAVATGAGLSYGNFRWLKAGVTGLTRAAATETGVTTRPVFWAAARFLLRFGLLGLALLAIIMTRFLPVAPLIWGLLAVPVAVMVEALLLMRQGVRTDD